MGSEHRTKVYLLSTLIALAPNMLQQMLQINGKSIQKLLIVPLNFIPCAICRTMNSHAIQKIIKIFKYGEENAILCIISKRVSWAA